MDDLIYLIQLQQLHFAAGFLPAIVRLATSISPFL